MKAVITLTHAHTAWILRWLKQELPGRYKYADTPEKRNALIEDHVKQVLYEHKSLFDGLNEH